MQIDTLSHYTPNPLITRISWTLFLASIFSLTSCTSPQPTGYRKELQIGGVNVYYSSIGCKPQVQWNGFDVSLEGLELPNTKDPTYKVGKLNYTQKSLHEIKENVVMFDGMLVSACQTLTLLKEQKSIIEYSKYRDSILSTFANTLMKYQDAPNEEVAKKVTAQSANEAKKVEESKPNI